MTAGSLILALLFSSLPSASSSADDEASAKRGKLDTIFRELTDVDDPRRFRVISEVDDNGNIEVEFCGSEGTASIELEKSIPVDVDCNDRPFGAFAWYNWNDGPLDVYTASNELVGQYEGIFSFENGELSAVVNPTNEDSPQTDQILINEWDAYLGILKNGESVLVLGDDASSLFKEAYEQ